MSGFSDYTLSLGMRDVINQFVLTSIDKLRPVPRYAKVDSIERGSGRCGVIYNGEENPVYVSATGLWPMYVGQTVRVEGIGTDKYITGVIGPTGATVSPGMVSMMAGVLIPQGWLLCNGQAVSRTTYSRLYSAIGNVYGQGDGSTTFNLPDLRGRVPVGIDTSDADFNAVGKKGGASKHRLAVTEMPSHTHIQNAHNHTQNAHNHGLTNGANSFPADGTTGGNWFTQGGNSFGFRAAQNAAATATNIATTATNQSTGGGGEHNNLQPYITMNYFIAF